MFEWNSKYVKIPENVLIEFGQQFKGFAEVLEGYWRGLGGVFWGDKPWPSLSP